MNEPGANRALRLHREGQLDEARAAYERLLEGRPEDPDLLGLLGVIEMQKGRTTEGEAMLRRALSFDGETRVRLRNVNNLAVLLCDAGRRDEARALVAEDMPDWPEAAAADAAERGTVISLAELLLDAGRAADGLRLLNAAIPGAAEDDARAGLAGRLLAATGAAEAALPLLERASAFQPADGPALVALAAVREALGQREAAEATVAEFASRNRFIAARRRPGHEATILIVSPAPRRIERPNATVPGLHAALNYPGQFADWMANRYRFMFAFGDVDHPDRPWEAEGAGLAINNMVNAEWLGMPGRLAAASEFVDGLGLPVVNHPAAAAECTRQRNAERLAGIPGLIVPRIERYRPAETGLDAVIADIREKFDWPVIIRGVASHQSSESSFPGNPRTAWLARSAGEVGEATRALSEPEIYAIQFVDLRRPEGWYRKIRAAVVGDRVMVSSGGIFGEWMVAGWRGKPVGIAYYRANPEAFRQTRAFLEDPDRELGSGFRDVLRAIRERMPLDLFGIDFDVDAEGRVVFFEAGAGMIFPHPTDGAPPELHTPWEPFRAIHTAFHDLVAQKIAEGADGVRH